MGHLTGTREKAAQEVLSGIKSAVVARKYGVTPSTVNQWVRDYREAHGEQDHPYPQEPVEELKRLLEVERNTKRPSRCSAKRS
ncbi:helix-turn-helix domain-containing protein [Paenibacillus sp. FSL P4-0338]|uniref:helix-turn-helix domain-containing protein n=1 Tax=unclassified Paenibacillus TaxID=185978 RepID=UPI0003E1EC3F|nr:helix-turn-helix domain-containing protein [Paenibacillus sp. FSL R7-269]ETT34339.1 hypothetical protein C162_29345 [Paenibacillus sp. FSL R7-269]